MNRIHRRFETDRGTYYVPVDICNSADWLHVDTHDPRSDGYGGSTLNFKLLDGLIDPVKGPWHTNSTAFRHDTGIDIEDLHETRVVLYKTRQVTKTTRRHERMDDGRLVWGNWPTEITEKVEPPIYEEKDFVLSDFYRGERIAHAIAALREEPIYVESYSRGGSSEHTVFPGKTKMHPLAIEMVNRG
jgi:hypothetical protein